MDQKERELKPEEKKMNVKAIQNEIVKAVRKGNTERVFKLKKLLMNKGN